MRVGRRKHDEVFGLGHVNMEISHRFRQAWLISSREVLFLFLVLFCCCVVFLFFWLHRGTYGILVPQPGMEPTPRALEAQSLNNWTTREFPRKTGKHFHNFISWQDLRAIELVKSWNSSLLMKVRKAIEEENCCFGTIDTWLLHKLTKGSEFATDFSNASTTGLFDPYEMCWSKLITSLLSIPLFLLPPVKDTSHNFGSVDEEIFGVPIPVVALVADQQSAMFGECCFQTGDVKLTMGTGTFLDINTGNNPQQSVGGFYPLIGWKIGQEVVCLAEGNAADTGTAIQWAQQLGFCCCCLFVFVFADLFTDAAETEKMARSLEDSEGVYFVPSFSGLQAPLNDPCACASFMGLKSSTNKYHLVRAILESIAFRNKQLYEVMQKEIHIPVRKIRADGGVCKNSFVMQMTSDLINETIDRPVHVDMSCVGAASLAGLAVGFWTDKEELKKLRQSEIVFKPQKKWQEYEKNMGNWVKAVKRSMNWYNKT
ncbi:glycerol kinase 5 isoform X4 [Tursiops truncatus]|uniref:glycerol kinase 5 isoform X4 n=1 Tax=Tursiops truncatus TaxID=9739 RepID=UPI003CCF1FA5